LTLNYLDDSGAPTGEYSSLIVGMDSDFVAFPYDPDGSVEVRLPKGTYAVDHTVLTGDPLHYNMISQPGLVLDGDQTVDVDARTAKPINVTPPAAAQLAIGDIGYSVATETFEFSSAFVTDDLGVLSTAQLGDPAPGTQLTGKVNTQWQGENGSFYGLTWYPAGEFPTGFEKQVGMDELATVRGQWGPGGEGHGAQRLAFGLPASGGGFIFGANLDVALPGTRTEYYTTDGVVWETSVTEVGADGQAAAQFDAPSRAYRAGRTYSAKFNNAVFGPGLPAREFPWAYRFADEMGVNLPLFTDAYGNAGFSIGDTSSTKLYAGDELVGESPEAGYGFFEDLPAEATDYRLTSDIVRSGWDVSTSISSEWTFSSAHVDGEVEAAVELNTVRFLPSLDENNSAPAGRPFLVPLLMQDETGALQRPKRLTVEVSYDEGKSWQRVPVLLNLVAALHHPDGAESVSLRASAADRDGNTVSQTVVRAYKLRK
ncbi:MAG TPA: hypothetical protein VNP92_01250, partial [Actinophytocola sp.]|nr:hypothetical protein [Actinophytocola sp.]